MNLEDLFRQSNASVISELQADEELWGLASTVGVDGAGEILPLRIHPDTMFADLPAYWGNLKAEFREFVCLKNPKYKDVYEKLEQARKTTDTWFIPIIAGGLAAKMGFETAVLVPFVRLMIAAVTKLGVEAFCRQWKELKVQEEPLRLE
jgi:hypothetical protein